jgi:hypothetical protein
MLKCVLEGQGRKMLPGVMVRSSEGSVAPITAHCCNSETSSTILVVTYRYNDENRVLNSIGTLILHLS